MTAIELRHKCIARMVTDWVAGLLDDNVFEPDAPYLFKKNKLPGTRTGTSSISEDAFLPW